MIDELLVKHKELSANIALLNKEKHDLEIRLLSMLPFNPGGQKTIETANCKVLVKAGSNFRVDQVLVLDHLDKFPQDLCPVKKKTTYELDKKVYSMLLMYPTYQEIAGNFVIEVPKKPTIEVL